MIYTWLYLLIIVAIAGVVLWGDIRWESKNQVLMVFAWLPIPILPAFMLAVFSLPQRYLYLVVPIGVFSIVVYGALLSWAMARAPRNY